MRSRLQDQPGQHGETPSLVKVQKINWMWWHTPVIPAAQEMEAGELLNLGDGGEIAPLHSSLGDRAKTLSQKEKEKKRKCSVLKTN